MYNCNLNSFGILIHDLSSSCHCKRFGRNKHIEFIALHIFPHFSPQVKRESRQNKSAVSLGWDILFKILRLLFPYSVSFFLLSGSTQIVLTGKQYEVYFIVVKNFCLSMRNTTKMLLIRNSSDKWLEIRINSYVEVVEYYAWIYRIFMSHSTRF